MKISNSNNIYTSKQLKNNIKHFTHIKQNNNQNNIKNIYGWGRKKSGLKAISIAKESNSKFNLLEDGMIRSFGEGENRSKSFSVVIDNVGIYYDATNPSKLENILNDDKNFQNHNIQNTNYLIDLLITNDLSKYNSGIKTPQNYFKSNNKKVLVINQTKGDESLKYGLAEQFNSKDIIKYVSKNYPQHDLYLKTHPDVLEGLKQSSLDINEFKQSGYEITSENFTPLSYLDNFDVVIVQTSQMGFEALLLGKEVVCFGAPYYSNWGVTKDMVEVPRRKTKRTVQEIFHAMYEQYSIYADPITNKSLKLEQTLFLIPYYKRMYQTDNKTNTFLDLSYWKQKIIPKFMFNKNFNFLYSIKHEVCTYFTWGMNKPTSVMNDFVRIEDGFIRSYDLGTNLTPPQSLIFDNKGIYFNTQKPNDLTLFLENNDNFKNKYFLNQASKLIQTIRQTGISKYNLKKKTKINRFSNRKTVLVIGQVDGDASIKFQNNKEINNYKMLLQARQDFKDSFLIYRPHPDILSGNRVGKLSLDEAIKHCDYLSENENLHSLFEVVDTVCVISSLSGLEALIYEKEVVCYGTPFYSGLGLTIDKYPHFKQKENRSLQELVAATYIWYPRYYDYQKKSLTDVFTVIDNILDEQKNPKKYQKNICVRIINSIIRKSVQTYITKVKKK